jgi:uncharacterized membrane protein YgcG
MLTASSSNTFFENSNHPGSTVTFSAYNCRILGVWVTQFLFRRPTNHPLPHRLPPLNTRIHARDFTRTLPQRHAIEPSDDGRVGGGGEGEGNSGGGEAGGGGVSIYDIFLHAFA